MERRVKFLELTMDGKITWTPQKDTLSNKLNTSMLEQIPPQ